MILESNEHKNQEIPTKKPSPIKRNEGTFNNIALFQIDRENNGLAINKKNLKIFQTASKNDLKLATNPLQKSEDDLPKKDSTDSKNLEFQEKKSNYFQNENLKKMINDFSSRLNSEWNQTKDQKSRISHNLLKKIDLKKTSDSILNKSNDREFVNSNTNKITNKKQKSLIIMKILNLNLQSLTKSDKIIVIEKFEQTQEIPLLFIWFIDFIELKIRKLLKNMDAIKADKGT